MVEEKYIKPIFKVFELYEKSDGFEKYQHHMLGNITKKPKPFVMKNKNIFYNKKHIFEWIIFNKENVLDENIKIINELHNKLFVFLNSNAKKIIQYEREYFEYDIFDIIRKFKDLTLYVSGDKRDIMISLIDKIKSVECKQTKYFVDIDHINKVCEIIGSAPSLNSISCKLNQKLNNIIHDCYKLKRFTIKFITFMKEINLEYYDIICSKFEIETNIDDLIEKIKDSIYSSYKCYDKWSNCSKIIDEFILSID